MDINSFDIEFYDFENATEEEIKEIRAILEGPGNNGSVELPWEKTLKENFTESLLDSEKENMVEETDSSVENNKCLVSMVGPDLHFTASQAPLSSPRPSAVEAFIAAPPTSVGPYPPYLMSRTIPYVRAYPHMGMPFFACPMPGNTTGEGSPSPYGQFVPVVPVTVAQDKFIGHTSEPIQKKYNRRLKKKSSSDYSSSSFESETVTEVALPDASSPTASDRPVPIVPLPPSTFGVAGGTIPLHGYPPGLLPYAPPPAASPMYYVPVFNHPYSSYLPSPIALHLQPDADPASVVSSSHSAPAKISEIVQSNEEEEAAKNMSEGETDCNSSSDYPNSKSVSSSPDYSTTDDFYTTKCDVIKREEDSSRCWADLFKKPPHFEVNGIDQRSANSLDKGFTNGNSSTSDVH